MQNGPMVTFSAIFALGLTMDVLEIDMRDFGVRAALYSPMDDESGRGVPRPDSSSIGEYSAARTPKSRMSISNTSIVSPRAKIAENVTIGPFCIVEDEVEIGAGTVLDSHV